MKTSNKWLSILVIAVFAANAGIMTVDRILLAHEPAAAAVKKVDIGRNQDAESGSAVVPADGVNWTRITLGLRYSFWKKFNQESSIFRDINLDLYFNRFKKTGLSFIGKPGKNSIAELDFTYRRIGADSKRDQQSRFPTDCFISIGISKYKKEEENPREREKMLSQYFRAVKSHSGVWEYWSQNNSACCSWTKGRWHTSISVPIEACGNDSAKAVELRDKIRGRLFAYYETLK
jgi:hypothetical protein